MSSRSIALFREAHRDVPTHAQRSHVWNGVEAGIASSAAAAGGLKAMGGLSKVLLGAVLGGAITATVAVLWMGRATNPNEGSGLVPLAPVVHTTGAPRTWIPSEPVVSDSNAAPLPAKAVSTAPHATLVMAAPVVSVAAAVPQDDSMAREARLVEEARGALLRGDADQALRIARAASSFPHPQMEPEELALEARALRELGRGAEADAVEADLGRRFPENALTH